VEEYVKASVEVVPLPMESEADLVHKLGDVSTGLQSHDWSERREALKRVRELAVGGAGQWECFVDHIRTVQDPIARAILDLRSNLAKEACSTVAVLAQASR